MRLFSSGRRDRRSDCDDLAVLVPHRGQVADLGHGDEPLVVRVVLRRDVQQVGVLRGRDALAVELLEPPDVQPLGGERVQAADGALLGERGAVRGRPEGDRLDLPVRGADRDGDPAAGPQLRHALELPA
jgi:hypothetical protein